MSKVITVKIADLKKDLFVRTALNQNHAIFLGELVEAGTELPPISITKEFVVIDGRHRIEAYELNGKTEIRAIVTEIGSDIELISKAFQANLGGSLPPTPDDVGHTVLMLLDRGVAQKGIADLLSLPPSIAKKYVKLVVSKNNRVKLTNAISAVTKGGLTVAQAAEKYQVKPEKITEALTNKTSPVKIGLPEIKRAITSCNKSNSLKNANVIKSLLDKYDDGDISEDQVREVFRHLEELHRRSNRSLNEWKARFEAKVKK